ncbi:MAG: hypothetical protein VYC20_01620, partial [Pseudomonadota bacterium]|nr:hypothetical protein [Pseudomonadota bacterium]
MSTAPVHQISRATGRSRAGLAVPIALLALAGLLFAGCAPAVIGAGTAAVAASSTDKGLSTSASDNLIATKLNDKFVQNDSSLVVDVDVSVNDAAVLMTGKVKTP